MKKEFLIFGLLCFLILGCWPWGPKPIKDNDGVAGYKWPASPNAEISVWRYKVIYWVDGKAYNIETSNERPFIGITAHGGKETKIDSIKTAGINFWDERGSYGPAFTTPVIVSQ